MKEKIETLLALNKEIKEHCYHLANKWSEYRKSLDPVVKDYECGIYNYIEISPDKIEFDISSDKGEIYFFEIGYSYSDRCGETESFYTVFTKEQLLDESLIKAEIDEVYQDKLDKQAKENEKIAKRKQEIGQKEFERYLELKEKFENTEEFVYRRVYK